MTEYKIVTAIDNIISLEQEVTNYLKNGYSIAGSLCVDKYEDHEGDKHTMYLQPMVK